jgi:hypothetical protein
VGSSTSSLCQLLFKLTEVVSTSPLLIQPKDKILIKHSQKTFCQMELFFRKLSEDGIFIFKRVNPTEKLAKKFRAFVIDGREE